MNDMFYLVVSSCLYIYLQKPQWWHSPSWKPCCQTTTSSCLTWDEWTSTRLDAFLRLSTSHVSHNRHTGPYAVSLDRVRWSLSPVWMHLSGHPGGVSAAGPRSLPAEVRGEGSGERGRQRCVSLQDWSQEFQGAAHRSTAGVSQVNPHKTHTLPSSLHWLPA